MNENIKEESTSKLKQENMNNSESERFNSPKDKKDLEISTSERNGKEDINEIIHFSMLYSWCICSFYF